MTLYLFREGLASARDNGARYLLTVDVMCCRKGDRICNAVH